MFSKSVVATTLLALASATAATTPASQCPPGQLQCCKSISSTVTATIATLLGSLGIDVSGVALPIGVTCSPITIIGAGGGSTCADKPVCCTNNSFEGIVALGCITVDLNL